MKKITYLLLSIMSVILIGSFLGDIGSKQPNQQAKQGEVNVELNRDPTYIQHEANSEAVELVDPLTDQIKGMTLSEKIGQLLFGGIDGTTYTDETSSLIKDYKLGGIILFKNNLEHPEQTLALLNQIKLANKQNNIPLLLGIDQEGGRVERLPDQVVSLPTNQAIGEKNNAQLSYDIGMILGEQLTAFGFNLNFAPVLDVNSNPANPVIGDRSFGSDPGVVSELGIRTMQGMQAKGIIPVIKHFPGHGDTSVDSHLELPQVEKSLQQLEELELIPFRRAIEAGADVVMTSHILLKEIDADHPASMSNEVITGLLRGHLNYDGVVVSDDMTMQAITDYFDIGQASVAAIKAGTDMLIVAHGHETIIYVIEALKAAIVAGELTEERIDESVRRIIQLKRDYGVADHLIDTIDVVELNGLIRGVLE